MNKENHPLNLQIKKADFLNVNSGTTLPYQLYQVLMSEAQINNKAIFETNITELSDQRLENIIKILEEEKENDNIVLLEKVTSLLQKRRTCGHHSIEPKELIEQAG